ncbi:unnamed protein product [Paramecium octaurelia]|uniref:Major facilitator superfamily (MFS) profile domain-containing protein n=1 Tax=Paramecium octaurelia TaxID=43137 RepID=A0A8S1WDY2_PAROT|nr:unnamed protein product [Paramecium octaurelia]
MKKFHAFLIFSTCNMFVSMCGSLITPFFPPYADKKGISQTTLGLIIAAGPLGGLLASIIIAKTLNHRNRNKYILIGVLGEPLSLLFFSLTDLFEDKVPIIIIASIGRFIGGIGTSLFLTPFFGYIPILYPKDVEKKVSISEAFSSVGFFAGPALGSALYALGGYLTPFLVFSSFGFLSLPFLYAALQSVGPKKYQVEVQRQIAEIEETKKLTEIQQTLLATQQLDGEQRLTFLSLVQHYPVVVIFWVITLVNICMTYFQPILSIYFTKQYDFDEGQIGFIMTIVSLAYTLGCYLCGYNKNYKREMACICLFFFGCAYFLAGPDTELIQVPHKLWIALMAQFLLGVLSGPAYVPSLPVLNEFLLFHYPIQTIRVATYSSALLTSGMFIGQLTGPIVAGILGDEYGFERACSILGVIIIVTSFIYVPIIFMKSKKENKQALLS